MTVRITVIVVAVNAELNSGGLAPPAIEELACVVGIAAVTKVIVGIVVLGVIVVVSVEEYVAARVVVASALVDVAVVVAGTAVAVAVVTVVVVVGNTITRKQVLRSQVSDAGRPGGIPVGFGAFDRSAWPVMSTD